MAVVTATLHFLSHDTLYETEKPYSIQYTPHGDIPQSNVKQQVVDDVKIHDIRPEIPHLDFDKDGFVVKEFHSEMNYDDFSDPDIVQRVYLEEVSRLLTHVLGSKNIALVEYLVRRRHQSFPLPTGEQYDFAQPVATAHIDFSPDGLVEIIQDRYADRFESLLKYRYRMVNVWKPLHGPVQDWPLVLCKPSSIDPEKDLQLMDRVNPQNIEESIQIHFNKSQKWYYLHDQKETEAIVFCGGDSAVGFNSGVPHCSFEAKDPDSFSGRPRESIEVRALVFDTDENLDLENVSISRRFGPSATFQQHTNKLNEI